MRVVAIGDEEEYTARLVRFLEEALPECIHVVSHTNPESFIRNMSSQTCYVTGEEFWKKCLILLNRDGQASAEKVSSFNHIIISDREEEGTFYRYHSPSRLVEMIEKNWEKNSEDLHKKEEKSHRLIAIYTPIYDEDMMTIVQHFMEEHSLYLGLEDMGDELNEKGDVSDLCYYIRLRDEQIFDRIKEIRRSENSRYFVDSPPIYYDFAELSDEDYRWFFQKYKKEGGYPAIYLGVGCAAVHNAEFFQHFDQVIIVDSRVNSKQHSFCKRFTRIIESGIPTPGKGFVVKYREDILYEIT